MDRIVVYFNDEKLNYINIKGTDIFEKEEYLHIYNGNDLVAIILASTIKMIYKSTKREQND